MNPNDSGITSRVSATRRSPGSAPATWTGPVSGWTSPKSTSSTAFEIEPRSKAPSNVSRVSSTTSSPGSQRRIGGMSGCQRLWPVCGSPARGRLRSIRISCVAMARTIGFSPQTSGGGEPNGSSAAGQAGAGDRRNEGHRAGDRGVLRRRGCRRRLLRPDGSRCPGHCQDDRGEWVYAPSPGPSMSATARRSRRGCRTRPKPSAASTRSWRTSAPYRSGRPRRTGRPRSTSTSCTRPGSSRLPCRTWSRATLRRSPSFPACPAATSTSPGPTA